MKVLETSFLVDYLNEQPYTVEYLEANPQDHYVVPTITLYELYAGALRSNTTDETISTIAAALEWADPVIFDDLATVPPEPTRSLPTVGFVTIPFLSY